MTTPPTYPDLAVRVDRTIAAELARRGMKPASDLPRITGLHEDTVRSRRRLGDWRLTELVTIADALGIRVSELVDDDTV